MPLLPVGSGPSFRPQVLENLRNQSVEGLALPFLINWLLGDFTNLIGCILTNQLPFQKYLASYFCVVDVSLMVQYFYYSRKAPPAAATRSRSRIARQSIDHIASVHSPAHYRALSSVAANVAASAALAANQETHWRRNTDAFRDTTASPDRHFADEAEDQVDEDALAMLADSIHSTRSRHGVSWSKERYANASRVLSPVQSFEPFPRGRAAERADGLEGEGEHEHEQSEAEEESRRRRNSRAGRMSASIVFMGAWALFGVGTLISGGRGVPRETGIRVGHVLADVSTPPPSTAVAMLPLAAVALPPADHDLLASVELPDEPLVLGEDAVTPEPPSMERIIGRIFAWTCTTLYLTSRLPQIWKNYVRKSVEGLSIYLFIFAFLGNFFYVISILTAPNMSLPPPEAAAYISESIPYLLGSGGTLMFDITIVVQSRIYKPKRGRKETARQGAGDTEEQEALMSASIRAELEEGQTPRRRTNAGEDEGRV